MNYQDAVHYIDQIPKYADSPVPAHTFALMEKLGNPQDTFPVIHVAGTNGKGSVCAYITSVLTERGYKTGTFTSPHLVRMNERIQINRQPVSDQVFLNAFLRVREASEALGGTNYFEFLFAMAMLIYQDAHVDYAVLEVGLGGRKDATNVIKKPVVSVITSISLDHTEYLGDTIAAIAGEKAGIIKEGVPVVYDASCPESAEVIRKKAEELHAPAYGITPKMYKISKTTKKHIDFCIDCGYYDCIELTISSVAEYQVKNAAEAVTAIRVMEQGGEFSDEVIRSGIEKMRWQGRMEQVLPGVIIDGAHNEAGVEEFVKTARRLEADDPVTLLFAAVGDKDYRHMIETICRELRLERVIVTEVGGYRSVDVRKPEALFREFGQKQVTACPDVEEAFDEAMKEKGDGILFCVGSLYLVGSIKSILKKRRTAHD